MFLQVRTVSAPVNRIFLFSIFPDFSKAPPPPSPPKKRFPCRYLPHKFSPRLQFSYLTPKHIPFGLLTRSNQPAIPAYQPTQSAHPKPSTGSARLFTSQRISSLENFVFKLTLLLCLFAQFVQFFQEYGSPYDDLVALTHEKFMPTSFCYAQAWQIRPKKVKDLSEPVLRKRKAPH